MLGSTSTKAQESFYLNFYGPAGAIPTFLTTRWLPRFVGRLRARLRSHRQSGVLSSRQAGRAHHRSREIRCSRLGGRTPAVERDSRSQSIQISRLETPARRTDTAAPGPGPWSTCVRCTLVPPGAAGIVLDLDDSFETRSTATKSSGCSPINDDNGSLGCWRDAAATTDREGERAAEAQLAAARERSIGGAAEPQRDRSRVSVSSGGPARPAVRTSWPSYLNGNRARLDLFEVVGTREDTRRRRRRFRHIRSAIA